jgi:hypothetical protein
VQAIADSPETVCAFPAAQIKEIRINYIVGQFRFGDLELYDMPHSVELFAAHVAPALPFAFKSLGNRGGRTALGAFKPSLCHQNPDIENSRPETVRKNPLTRGESPQFSALETY